MLKADKNNGTELVSTVTVLARNDDGSFAMENKGGPGRPKGTLNKRRKKVVEFCMGVIESPAFRDMFVKRAEAGLLKPAEMQILFVYAMGPPQTVARFGEDTDWVVAMTDGDRSRYAFLVGQGAIRGLQPGEKDELVKLRDKASQAAERDAE